MANLEYPKTVERKPCVTCQSYLIPLAYWMT